MGYSGDGVRVTRIEDGVVTHYLRSSVLGGQVVADLNSDGARRRGYVYLGSQMLAIQRDGVWWVHQDPVAKSQRFTDGAGTWTSSIELDPWGGEMGSDNGAANAHYQPHRFTTYERDKNERDDANMRRYEAPWSRFNQPDPYDGSYNLTDPQSFNRYAYTQNDPVNFTDPSGLQMGGCSAEFSYASCGGDGGFWGGGGLGSGGGGGFGDDVAAGQDLAGMPANVRQAILRYEFNVNNALRRRPQRTLLRR
ncbi:MAG: RHS repeat-associated core domain-containing protein [Pyrinomonadaceae bacterium]